MTKTPKTEDEKRADEVLRRMLNTPPKPRKKSGDKADEQNRKASNSKRV
jgi:hypothetical protein